MPVRIRDLGEETIEIDRLAVRAKRYQIEAEKTRIELWYSKQGEWLALQSMTENGKTIKYRLTGGASLAKQRALDPGDPS